MDIKDLKITVIYGGISSEREVSLRSGKAVYEALRRGGFKNVGLFDLTRENIGELSSLSCDVAYLALHGKGGEDGCIQGMLELLGIPYTGSGVLASASCMDKIRTKELLDRVGLPTPRFVTLTEDECADREATAKRLSEKIGLPMVLKSPCEGSSIGVYIVKDALEVEKYIGEIFKYGDALLCEQFIDGVELTLPIVGNEELTVFPAIEITSENEFYDYESKYTEGMCHHIIPARISAEDAERISEIGKKAYRVLGCRGLSRIDMILDKVRGPMIIEINNLPGMTEMSLFPDSARYAGVPFEKLVEMIVAYAVENFDEKDRK
ncbi:MAG: D-alanine--D-alanine ligase [Clostridia bacterium]|nr:D-alanine--D-alanine ligase [Clostridia bacterium]